MNNCVKVKIEAFEIILFLTIFLLKPCSLFRYINLDNQTCGTAIRKSWGIYLET